MVKIIQITDQEKRNTIRGNRMCREFVVNIRKKSKRIEDMPARAQEVLNYFKISDLISGVPIVDILIKLGFKVYQSNLKPDGLSAYIAVDPKYEDIFESNKITCVHVKDNIGHKRFALAHELAHYLFDFNEDESLSYYNTYFLGEDEQTFEEERANKFAANLLMPENFFQKKIKEYEKLQSKADIVNELGRYFLVSTTAILKRFEELKIPGYGDNVGI